MKVRGYTIEPKANLYKADLYKANLRGASLSGADLRGADLSEANLSEAILPDSLIFFGYSPQGYSRFVFIEPQGLRIVMGCRTFNSFDEARQHFTDPSYKGGSRGKVGETLAAIAYAETVCKERTEQ